MRTRECFYHTDDIEAFQVLSFNDENTNPVEIEIQSPVEYEVNKGRNFHSIRIFIDKDEFTQLARQWLKSQNVEV